jgi:hypothetical protein
LSENSFTDSEGEVYVAEQGEWVGEPTIKLWVSESTQEIVFYKADAAKIIALIAEAAAVKPTWEAVNAQIDSLLDTNEPTEDMGQ